jgi:uncharacterized repeat protein (TIGR01451 family)
MAPAPAAAKADLTTARMLDARVNAKDAYQHATAARQGRAAAGFSAAQTRATAIASAISQLRQTLPSLEVKVSKLTGGPEVVSNQAGSLTAAAPGASSESIVRGFLRQNGGLYGLTASDVDDLVVLGDSAGGTSGLRMLRVEQQIGGRPVFQSETRFLLDRDGRLSKSVGRFVPGARALAPQVAVANLISAADAVSRLVASTGRTASPAAFTVASDNAGRLELAEADGFVAGPITARQVLFPLAPGLLVPAWSLVVFTEGDADFYAIVDAETGDVLWRKNIRNYVSTHDARFRVFVQADGVTPADSPAPASPNTATAGEQFAASPPSIVSMLTAQNIAASAFGWINDCPGGICTANETQTTGNNLVACMDRTVGGANTNVCDTDAASQLDGNGRPTGNPDANTRNRDFLGTTPRDFQTNFLPPPQTTAADAEVGQTATGAGNGTSTGPTDIFRRGVVTQLFYVGNWYHDRLYALGFDEASANFQNLNNDGSSPPGSGDHVLADAQDGSGTNNANFATPPDGTSGRAQMFRFTGPTIDRDGDLDSEILIHELTHGTSNRLVGNAAGLNWDPAGGMGEGWSDFYAISLLNNTNADGTTGRFPSGAYATYKLGALLDNYTYGIRRFPYTTDNTVNPMTWADVDDVTNSMSGGSLPGSPLTFNNNGGMEVHNSGEIWALTLWEVRSRIIADPAGANGDVPTGNNTALEIVTDGLKMTPIDPSFTDGRDAIIDADCATNACANEESIWGGFADRGLGYGARTPFNVLFGFTAGHLGVDESFSSPYLDVVNAATDVTVNDSASNNNGTLDPGEVAQLTVALTNPWRAASKAVTGATATLSTSTPGVSIFDNTSTYGAIAPQGSATGDSFLITLDTTVLCGSAIDFTLSVTSNLGTTATTFRVRVGAASGTDPVVTYTRDTNPDLAIPDGRPLAVFDTVNVTDDFQIADLDFRVDSATHTFTGDLTFMLRSPGGIGVDSIALIGALTDGGPGDNLLNTRSDDDLASSAAVDLVQQTAAGAPFTASWLPVFNAPWTTLAGFPPEDPVGNLSRFDGASTLGTWSVAASDQFAADTGTLNAWSMLVTPVHFACTAFVPAANVAATKTVSGTFTVGGTVTYTVTLTNNGTDNQSDNAGNEFTDVLPAGLTLVSAAATSGTASTSVNTVTWNGSLAPLGGTVTITITATINAGANGTTISNQGTVSYDANNDNVNEASGTTDDPGVGGAADPTSFVVGGATVSATKTATGTFAVGGTVTYTITINNTGGSASPDNPGNEFTDVLPASLTLVSASASAGTAVASVGINTVTWNGSVPAAGSVTITITATINAGTGGTTIDNQGSVSYDADLNGTNESTVATDDPSVGGTTDPTGLLVAPDVSVVEVPTVSEVGLLLLALGLVSAAWVALRRRSLQA